MAHSKIVIERIHGFEDVVRIPLANITDSKSIINILRVTFEECFNNGKTKILVDLKNLQFPSSSLIALLIEATSRARKFNGDVKIINISHSAKNNLATFSPLSYLSLEKDENYALQDFNDSINEDAKPIIPAVDIVDDPIIEKLQKSIEEPAIEKDVQKNREVKKTVTNAATSNHLRVKSMTNNLYEICDFVTNDAEKVGFNAKDIGKIRIAIYEACLNIIEHAYHSNPDNWIDVWVEYDSKLFTVVLQDYGIGFEELNTQDYDVLSAMDHRKTGGFGLYIIQRSMDKIDYKSDEINGNRFKLVKYIKR